MCRIALFRHKTPDISIYIDAYFDAGRLIIEGQDLGKTVEDWWGDSDYEYSLTVPAGEVNKLYPLLKVEKGDKEGLLNKIAAKYNTNSCYSDFMSFLRSKNIEFEGFTWA
jgi:hypothetical protein